MAQKKGGGSTRNGRDSQPKMLGVKAFGGEAISAGSIIVRQRGTKFKPGDGAGGSPPAPALRGARLAPTGPCGSFRHMPSQGPTSPGIPGALSFHRLPRQGLSFNVRAGRAAAPGALPSTDSSGHQDPLS